MLNLTAPTYPDEPQTMVFGFAQDELFIGEPLCQLLNPFTLPLGIAQPPLPS